MVLSPRQRQLMYAANDYDKAVIGNGCGPAAMSRILPDAIEVPLRPFFNLEFLNACTLHDILYKIGGKEKDRKASDVFFRKMMKRAVALSTRYENGGYKSLESTKWYQVKWKNIKRGFLNIGKGIKKGTVNTGIFLKKQYLVLKVHQYYFLVRKFGESSFNFKKPMQNREEFPSYSVIRNKKIKNVTRFHGRYYIEYATGLR